MQYTSRLYHIVDLAFWLYSLMLIVRILSSWFPDLQEKKAMRLLAFYTDPYLNIFRRIIPPLGMLDISPVAAIFALQLLETVVKNIIR